MCPGGDRAAGGAGARPDRVGCGGDGVGPTAPEPRPAPSASAASHIGALESLIAAFGATRAEKAVDAIGHGFVLMEAQKRIAATERKLAREAAAEPEPTLTASEEVLDPAEMAPASAGSNGTTVPHHGGGKLFAHTRADDNGSTAILLSGIALAPPDAPEAVQKVINNANTIVGRPYVWGGGHASFYSYGYDCSGSVSYALFGGGLIPEPLTSGVARGLGRTRPRQVDHRLRQRRAHLHGDRRAALGHGRRRPRHRPPLAPDADRHRRASSPATRRASSASVHLTTPWCG